MFQSIYSISSTVFYISQSDYILLWLISDYLRFYTIGIQFASEMRDVTRALKPMSHYALEIEDCELEIRIQPIRTKRIKTIRLVEF